MYLTALNTSAIWDICISELLFFASACRINREKQQQLQEETAWHQFVERESAAFLGDKATKFARELRRFVGSGMTVRSYDRHTEAVGPNEGGGSTANLEDSVFSYIYADSHQREIVIAGSADV